MSRRRSVIAARNLAQRVERDQLQSGKTADSFQNFLFNMGVGTANPTSSSTYGFNPITRNHTLLEWVHRGSWLGGVAVDLVADDMTRAGIDFTSTMKPEDGEELHASADRLAVWPSINDAIKWSRLYGGCIAAPLIDGQDMATPLYPDRLRKGQFKGLIVLDRWMVEPSLNNLVTELGPSLGLPKFYKVSISAPAIPNMTIHHSRVLRLEGIRLPYWQRVAENMWGESVIERLYDRMIAFDSATTGAAQLVYRAHLRTIKVESLREAIAESGLGNTFAVSGIFRYFEMMRRFQSIEGMSLIDSRDEFEVSQATAFSGLADALNQFGQQLAGALQIPLTRLFGQSPGGLNSSGDSDLRTYYDGIMQRQKSDLGVFLLQLYKMIAISEGIPIPKDFRITFNSLWQMTPEQKAAVASTRTNAVLEAGATVLKPSGVLRELRQIGRDTGTFTNITDKDIKEAEDLPAPDAMAETQELNPKVPGGGGFQGSGGAIPRPAPKLPGMEGGATGGVPKLKAVGE